MHDDHGNHHDQGSEKEDNAVDVYDGQLRGHRYRVERPRGRREGTRLFIDDEEIVLEEYEGGVMSHDIAFKMYGSPEELAEDLIRQWGTARIQRTHIDHPHH
jgi:hypothetical protein